MEVRKFKTMTKRPCNCLLKLNLEESEEPYKYLVKHYPVVDLMNDLRHRSRSELKCLCCLFGTVLRKMFPEENLPKEEYGNDRKVPAETLIQIKVWLNFALMLS